MAATTKGYALSIAELGQTVPLTLRDPEADKRLRAALKDETATVSVRLDDDADVEGHTFAGALRSVALRLHVDENDTEGHAVSVHFPTAADADNFRKRLIATGIIAGSLVFASAAAIGVTSAPAAPGVTLPAQTAPIERPAGHGALEYPGLVAPATAGAGAVTQSGINEGTGRPVISETQEGTDVGMGAAYSSDIQAPAVQRPAGSGPVEGSGSAPAQAQPGTSQGNVGGGFVEGAE